MIFFSPPASFPTKSSFSFCDSWTTRVFNSNEEVPASSAGYPHHQDWRQWEVTEVPVCAVGSSLSLLSLTLYPFSLSNCFICDCHTLASDKKPTAWQRLFTWISQFIRSILCVCVCIYLFIYLPTYLLSSISLSLYLSSIYLSLYLSSIYHLSLSLSSLTIYLSSCSNSTPLVNSNWHSKRCEKDTVYITLWKSVVVTW